jgi:hypothetical protein
MTRKLSHDHSVSSDHSKRLKKSTSVEKKEINRKKSHDQIIHDDSDEDSNLS